MKDSDENKESSKPIKKVPNSKRGINVNKNIDPNIDDIDIEI